MTRHIKLDQVEIIVEMAKPPYKGETMMLVFANKRCIHITTWQGYPSISIPGYGEIDLK